VRALLEALRRLLGDDELRRRKGAAAREYALTQEARRSAERLASQLLTA
jgi:hypothetical protein